MGYEDLIWYYYSRELVMRLFKLFDFRNLKLDFWFFVEIRNDSLIIELFFYILV